MNSNFDSTKPYLNFLKRITDIILAFVFLVISSPVFFLLAFLIKLEGLLDKKERGPVFRHEVRVSGGRPFHFYKFRLIKQSILDEEAQVRRRDRAKTLEKDEFCTRVGRWAKKWYLDELPQFINILRGDMSLVGPRPFPLDDYEDDVRHGRDRKKAVPGGLTGLVQVNKGNHGIDDIELDNEYVHKCRTYSSVRLWFYDLWLMFRTLLTLAQGKGL